MTALYRLQHPKSPSATRRLPFSLNQANILEPNKIKPAFSPSNKRAFGQPFTCASAMTDFLCPLRMACESNLAFSEDRLRRGPSKLAQQAANLGITLADAF